MTDADARKGNKLVNYLQVIMRMVRAKKTGTVARCTTPRISFMIEESYVENSTCRHRSAYGAVHRTCALREASY